MKTIAEIQNQIKANESTGLKIAFRGLSIKIDNNSNCFNSIADLKKAVNEIETNNLYSLDIEVSTFMFLSIEVKVSYLQENELNIRLNVVRISRNINAFDINYDRIDDSVKYEFWNKLHSTIQNRINDLTTDEVELLKTLSNSNISIFNVPAKVHSTEKSKLFKTAWQLVRTTKKKFAVCLSMAWNLLKLRKRMNKEIVLFTFEKADGTLRKAKGTLQNVKHLVKGTGKENYSTFNYFDIDTNAFRSFRIDNLITVF